MKGVAVLLLLAGTAQAQTIAQRVGRAPDGSVRMTFAAKPGVCGNGRNISTSAGSSEWESDCDTGPVRVALTLRNRSVTDVRTYVGGRWRASTAGVTDLGTVGAREAVDYLVGLANRDDAEGREAIFPATLADSVTIWPMLLSLARNPTTSNAARKQAVFWLGQAAGAAATAGLDSIVYVDSVDRSIKEQAVFALSQRPKDESIPVLIRVARTHRDPAIRKKALFWLAQSGDDRALAVFEEMLSR